MQLGYFREMGVKKLFGVEPSDYLANEAECDGLNTLVGLFGQDIVEKMDRNFSICLSSYTFDHVSDPVDYLLAANSLLELGGLLSFEVHDLDRIIDRTEYCLFEHEHTIYLDSQTANMIVEGCGFEVMELIL